MKFQKKDQFNLHTVRKQIQDCEAGGAEWVRADQGREGRKLVGFWNVLYLECDDGSSDISPTLKRVHFLEYK